jgi:lipopolysaccharide/colanic/teichoic acid biosynthesis glycosyltransferase
MSTRSQDPRDELTARSAILTEELFRGILSRERKRSDRSRRPFGLLLVGLPTTNGPSSTGKQSDAALDALLTVTRDTDIVGWVKARALVGVIVPDLGEHDIAKACDEFRARYRRELAERSDSEVARGVSILVHTYPGSPPRAENGFDPLHVALPSMARRSRKGRRDVLKRGLDLTASLALLALLSPALLLIGILVKLTSRGTVLFQQVRIGQDMKPFKMLKFRTMQSNADHKIHQEFVSSFIKGNGQGHHQGSNGFFKITNDPRVTRIGRILRKTSLDELPQLWNVVRDEMSLVGPRPPLPYELEQYESWHCRRLLEAKPGITGLWQVTGRSRTTFDEMVRLDLQYARTRSLWTDIKILLATPAAVLSGKGAC